ncbi:MerR family transcriptional regulator [Crossiella sp. CA-258035]|uniref:MerR family transcriptional regulator n=1 Tax=Crossiella sp. CA-258035 TaxID=2981138 RepID=UPI0024BBF19D|nr:MerR family transcriptional regulator [Crossiella sp. CA-258035]WHT22950.1 MerR family transcriptional regulator [Crossiella sp. CA-258035]
MSPVPPTAPADQDVTWTAGAVARMLDLPASTVRGWHRRYRIPAGLARPGRHRRYTTGDIDALRRMKQLIDRGMSARSAAHVAFPVAARATGADDLLAAVSRLDTDAAVALLHSHFTAHGIVHTWQTLCCPALNALGGPEATDVDGCIDLVHALSWAITMALHRLPAPATNGPDVLLACVEGERHTLPLEALRAALAQDGVNARLLGASVPLAALSGALHRTDAPPAALVLWAHRPTDPGPINDLATPHTRLMLTGPGWPNGSAHARSLAEAITLLTPSSNTV